MAELTATIPLTYVAGTVRGAFEEFESVIPSAKGLRCKACLKSYVVMSEAELPAHDCTGTYDKNRDSLPVTAL